MEWILATFQGKKLYLLLAIKLIQIAIPPQVTINIFKGQPPHTPDLYSEIDP